MEQVLVASIRRLCEYLKCDSRTPPSPGPAPRTSCSGLPLKAGHIFRLALLFGHRVSSPRHRGPVVVAGTPLWPSLRPSCCPIAVPAFGQPGNRLAVGSLLRHLCVLAFCSSVARLVTKGDCAPGPRWRRVLSCFGACNCALRMNNEAICCSLPLLPFERTIIYSFASGGARRVPRSRPASLPGLSTRAQMLRAIGLLVALRVNGALWQTSAPLLSRAGSGIVVTVLLFTSSRGGRGWGDVAPLSLMGRMPSSSCCIVRMWGTEYARVGNGQDFWLSSSTALRAASFFFLIHFCCFKCTRYLIQRSPVASVVEK